MLRIILAFIRRKYLSLDVMPADSLTQERYVCYSADDTCCDDDKNVRSIDAECLALRETEYVDLTCVKHVHTNGNALRLHSPSPSTSVSDKWRSYWSRRERWCCFCNFILSATVTVLIILIVLATKGVVYLGPKNDSVSQIPKEKFYSIESTPVRQPLSCPTPNPSDVLVRITHTIFSFFLRIFLGYKPLVQYKIFKYFSL